MLSIRLSRRGTKKKPVYRIIVVEKARDPYGRYLENLGTYNPHTKDVVIKADRVKYWISEGAQATPTVHNLLVSQSIIEGEKVRASKSKPGKKKRAELAEKKKAKDDESTKEKPATTEEAPAETEVKEEKPAEVKVEDKKEEAKPSEDKSAEVEEKKE